MMMCDGLVIYEVAFRPSLSYDVVLTTEIPNSSGKVFKINWERRENKPIVFHKVNEPFSVLCHLNEFLQVK